MEQIFTDETRSGGQFYKMELGDDLLNGKLG